jgi:hypothetical protein
MFTKHTINLSKANRKVLCEHRRTHAILVHMDNRNLLVG